MFLGIFLQNNPYFFLNIFLPLKKVFKTSLAKSSKFFNFVKLYKKESNNLRDFFDF